MNESPIRVVLIDDDESMLQAGQLVLRQNPRIQVVATGANGREAIQLANRHRPDVMVLDVHMPVMDGLEATARIARVFPSIGLIIMTSEDAPEIVKDAFRSGAREYLDKAREISQLASAVVRVDSLRDRSAPSRGMACLWGFHGPKGSAGTTRMAVDTACELALLDYRVLLVDLDALQGDCAFYLNIGKKAGARHLWSEVAELTTIDEPMLGAITRQYELPGVEGVELSVIDSPCVVPPSAPGVGEHLTAVMEAFLTRYDYVIVDFPPTRLLDPLFVPILDLCERLFLVNNRDLSSLKNLTRLIRLLSVSSFSSSRISVMLSPLLIQGGVDPREYLRRLDIAVQEVTDVPMDAVNCDEASRRGLPLRAVSPTGPLARFMSALVYRCLNLTPLEPKPTGLWERVKRAFLP